MLDKKRPAEGQAVRANNAAQVVRDAALAVGLSILLPYFRGYFLSPVKAAEIHATAALEGAFLAFAVLFALGAVAVVLWGERLTSALRGRGLLWGLGVAGALGTLLLWLPPLGDAAGAGGTAGAAGVGGTGGAVETVQCVVGAAANVAFFLACLLRYAAVLERLDTVRCVVVVSLGFGLSFSNNLFYLLPAFVQAAVCVALPLVAAACAPPAPAEPAADSPRPQAALFFDAAPIAFAVLLWLFCLTGNFVRGVTNPWFAISGVTMQSLYMTLTNLALVAATLVLVARRVPVNRVVFFNWIVYMLMFFAGVLIMAIAPVESAHVGSNLATTSRVGFTLLMLLFALSPERWAGRWAGMGLARRVGLFLLVPESLAAIVRFAVVPAYLGAAGVEPSALFTYSAAAVIFVLSAAIAVMLGGLLLRSSESEKGLAAGAAQADGALPGEGPDAPALRPLTDDEVAVRIAGAYGLTPREADVARHVSQGYSLEKTADLLGVTINTVRTHTRSIYAKLGIHNRQELIELAQRIKAGE